jgi:hypothetical protein
MAAKTPLIENGDVNQIRQLIADLADLNVVYNYRTPLSHVADFPLLAAVTAPCHVVVMLTLVPLEPTLALFPVLILVVPLQSWK